MSDSHEGGHAIAYPTRSLALAAFDLAGFTQIVQSGGALYEGVRRDGRWDELRRLAGEDGSIYGVASHDHECPEGWYRYTMAVADEPLAAGVPGGTDRLHTIHIGASEWVAFALEDFAAQYGRFWRDNPYALIERLGREFNTDVGLHLDVFGPTYCSDHDGIEFLMPVRRPV